MGRCLCLPRGPGRFLTRCGLSGSQEQSCRLALRASFHVFIPTDLASPPNSRHRKSGTLSTPPAHWSFHPELLESCRGPWNVLRWVPPQEPQGCIWMPGCPRQIPDPAWRASGFCPFSAPPAPPPGPGVCGPHRLHLHFPEDLSLESVQERVPLGKGGAQGRTSLCAPELRVPEAFNLRSSALGSAVGHVASK